ncbi:MAG: membrane protein insertase YidC [Acidobacteria bacterium]|nr:membrane protein insertase YidC [Acidobacteriota bacterium]
MNYRRFLAMIVACMAFFIVMDRWVAPTLGLVEEVPIEEELPDEPVDVVPSETEPMAEPLPVEAESFEVTETVEAREDWVENDWIRVRLDNRGGVVREVILKQFHVSVSNGEPIRVVVPSKHAPGEIVLSQGGKASEWMFHVETPDSHTVVYSATRGQVQIRKRFSLSDRYQLELECQVTGDPQALVVVADGLRPMSAKDFERPGLLSMGAINPKLMEVVWFADGDRENRAAAKVKDSLFSPLLEEPAFISWFGMSDSFFGNVFRPDEPVGQIMVASHAVEGGQSDHERVPVVAVTVDETLKGSFYFGPKSATELKRIDPDLVDLVDYGVAGVLSKLLYKALSALHTWTGNWGWAIVLLTILIRAALLPMTIPSVRSSFRMRKLQPQLDALKKKFPGNDLESRQKMQMEQMALYKKEGINPFASCFIMLPQVPIFIAYFSLLRNAIDLRQSEWIWWIQDLSVKDGTFVLPILMGATMFLTQLTMPMPGDPAQQKMMRFMPLMFTLMFVAMPSGLILYMITSNFFQLGQTMVMKWRYQGA